MVVAVSVVALSVVAVVTAYLKHENVPAPRVFLFLQQIVNLKPYSPNAARDARFPHPVIPPRNT